jgi:S1-C subfamily serine protease
LIFIAKTPAPVVHPSRGDLLDLILLAVAVLYAIRGYRRGVILGVLSFGGWIAGAGVGALLAPKIARVFFQGTVHAQHGLGRRLLGLAVVIVFSIIGEYAGGLIGIRLRRAAFATPLRVFDSIGGAAFSVAGLLFVAWLVATPLSAAPFPKITRQIKHSAILATVDRVLPGIITTAFSDLGRLFQQHGFPRVFNPFAGSPLPSLLLPAPNAGVVPSTIRKSGPEVVKITGLANSCSLEVEGSGFVYAPQHVMTNAHVVAGVTHPRVTLPAPGAATLAARVVLYDPDRDIAVLFVPGLRRPPLRFDGTMKTRADGVVAGYPENGPLTAVPARVGGEQEVTGPNIYGNKEVTRDVYTLSANVRHGNSGGPLLTPSGEVGGVIFAASAEVPNVGYALTDREVAPDARRGATATRAVSTQGCD